MEPGVVERPLAEPARPRPTTTATAPASGLVFVLSGPSGVGKSTLIDALKRDNFPITHCVTATTRPRRPGEVHAVHYFFLTESEYDAWLAADEFLEHAVVHNLYRYGIPLDCVRSGLRAGKDLIMAPDVSGARTVRQKLPNAITIFLLPPSLDQLPPRLAARGTESPEERRIRFETAKQEIQLVNEFDYVVINHQDRLPEALDDLKAIITAERLRVNPRVVTVPDDGDG
ncbi:MAG: guanylate kinase [Chloroflexi bacterium]|nr:guanylate kinase [Chloroflexota bacterium]